MTVTKSPLPVIAVCVAVVVVAVLIFITLKKRREQREREQKRAEEILKELPYENLGYANLDHHRQLRNGYGETVYCESKTAEQIEGILHSFQKMGSNVMGTRVKPEQYPYLKERFPELIYHPEARIIMLMDHPVEQVGMVAVCTAGTSDIPVAEEAALTAEFFGDKVDRVYDVGVAGIHRLFGKIDRIQSADVIIVIAGMEGALASVVGGLVEVPVIAVPTSVGYGASFGGLAALLSMLNSCANGIGVVNIDNGYGAACLANKIMKR